MKRILDYKYNILITIGLIYYNLFATTAAAAALLLSLPPTNLKLQLY